MTGVIRTNEKCKKCGKAFSRVKSMGFFCVQCFTHPHRFFVDIFIDGKRRKIYVDKHGKVLDSYRAAEDLLAEINQKIKDKKLNVDQYKLAEYRKYQLDNFIDLYLSEKSKNNLSPSYLKKVNEVCRSFSRFFYATDIRNIKSIDISRFRDTLTQKASSQRLVLTIVKNIFKEAQGKELIDKIPLFPKIQVSEDTWNWIDSNSQADILRHLPEEDYNILKFTFLHGVRISEALALKVKDIDLKNQSILIRRTFSLGQVMERTKQKRINLIPIHPSCLDFLKSVKGNSLPEAFVFVNRKGRPHTDSTLRRHWYKACRLSGASNVKLYDASRHSFASQLVNADTPLQVVSKLLGHSNIKTTQRYAHLNLDTQRAAMHKLSVDCPSIDNKNKKTLNKQ